MQWNITLRWQIEYSSVGMKYNYILTQHQQFVESYSEFSEQPWSGLPRLPPIIRYLHIFHNTPCLPPKILHNLCFSFLLGIEAMSREIKKQCLCKIWWDKQGVFWEMCMQVASGSILQPNQNEAANSIKANVITDEGIRMDSKSSE